MAVDTCTIDELGFLGRGDFLFKLSTAFAFLLCSSFLQKVRI